MENSKNKEQVKEEIKDKTTSTERNNTPVEPQIVFSINVLQNGSIIAIENGTPLSNIMEISFHAEVGKSPEYSIKKKLLN